MGFALAFFLHTERQAPLLALLIFPPKTAARICSTQHICVSAEPPESYSSLACTQLSGPLNSTIATGPGLPPSSGTATAKCWKGGILQAMNNLRALAQETQAFSGKLQWRKARDPPVHGCDPRWPGHIAIVLLGSRLTAGRDQRSADWVLV